MADPFLKAAQKEVAKWEDELRQLPAFRHWLAAKAVVDAFQQDEAVIVPKVVVGPKQPVLAVSVEIQQPSPKTSEILVKAAGDYLREVGHRVTSTDLAKELVARGISIPGKNQASTLSAYLSASKEINNKRPHGYGLKEWSEALPHGSSASSKEEAPEGGNPSGASTLNGHRADAP